MIHPTKLTTVFILLMTGNELVEQIRGDWQTCIAGCYNNPKTLYAGSPIQSALAYGYTNGCAFGCQGNPICDLQCTANTMGEQLVACRAGCVWGSSHR